MSEPKTVQPVRVFVVDDHDLFRVGIRLACTPKSRMGEASKWVPRRMIGEGADVSCWMSTSQERGELCSKASERHRTSRSGVAASMRTGCRRGRPGRCSGYVTKTTPHMNWVRQFGGRRGDVSSARGLEGLSRRLLLDSDGQVDPSSTFCGRERECSDIARLHLPRSGEELESRSRRREPCVGGPEKAPAVESKRTHPLGD